MGKLAIKIEMSASVSFEPVYSYTVGTLLYEGEPLVVNRYGSGANFLSQPTTFSYDWNWLQKYPWIAPTELPDEMFRSTLAFYADTNSTYGSILYDLEIVDVIEYDGTQSLDFPIQTFEYNYYTYDSYYVEWSEAQTGTVTFPDYFWYIFDIPSDVTVAVLGGSDVIEGNPGDGATRFLRFRLELDSSSNDPISVDYTTDGVEALPGIDFSIRSGTAIFPPGEQVIQIDVPIFSDFDPEGTEGVRLSISNARSSGLTLVSISNSSSTLNIKNDDPGLTLASDQSVITLIEGQTPPPIEFTLERAVDFPLTVTATLDSDQGFDQLDLGSGTIPAGATSASLEGLINPVLDGLVETNMFGRVLISVEGNGEPVPFSVSGQTAFGHTISFELVDDAINNPLADGSAFARSIQSGVPEALGIALKESALIDSSGKSISYGQYLVQGGDDFDFELAASVRQGVVAKFASSVTTILSAANVAIDGSEAITRLDQNLALAEAAATPRERSDLLYQASREAYVDIVDISFAAIFSVLAAEAGGAASAYAAGYAATSLGISALALPFIAGLGAAVLIGAGGVIVYNELFRDNVRDAAENQFSDRITPTEFENFLKTGQPIQLINSLSVEDDNLVASAESEFTFVGPGNDQIIGTIVTLNDDFIAGFGPGDSIVFDEVLLSADSVVLGLGSTIIEVDENSDGITDTTLTLVGDEAPTTLVLSQRDGDTILTVDGPGTTISITSDELEVNVITGSSGSDNLGGTDAADAIRSLGGSYDKMFGGEGADQFIFGSEANNGTRERDVILDYQVGVDEIVLQDGASVASIRETSSQVVVFLEGDRDAIYVRGDGVTADNITIVTDDVFALV